MKIALAQINSVINDFEGNSLKILSCICKAKEAGARLIVFPELCFCGYPPRDLLLRNDFISSCLDAFYEFTSRAPGDIGIIIGSIHRDIHLYNTAFLIYDRNISAVRHKSLLPEYDVFDERRYFEPSSGNRPVIFDNIRLGITICEDIWTYDHDLSQRYSHDPVKELCREGIDLLVNISASPFTKGKLSKRKNMLRNLSMDKKTPVLYVNTVGANDSLIFDGFSMVHHPEKGLILQLDGFREDLGYYDTDIRNLTSKVCCTDLGQEESILQALFLGVKDYMAKTGFKKSVLGLSGGIDSALVAYIAAKAVGSENVLGISMPSDFSSRESLYDAEELAENLGIEFKIIPISKVYHSYKEILENYLPYELDITYQNIQARIRGNILMAVSNRNSMLVLTTGNKSEFSTGYSTLYGDMAGGLAVLSDVTKTDIYSIAGYINKDKIIIPENIITKPPSAELKPGQKDSDELPPYGQLDYLIEMIVEKSKGIKDLSESGIPEKAIHRFLQLFERAEFKRQQAPLGLKISSNAFGYGRRIPIAMKKTF